MKRFLTGITAMLCMASAFAFTTDTVTVATELLATPMKVTVITPDNPDNRKFPTVYLLNGYTGDYRQWTNQTSPGIGKLADLYGMILVMPDGRDSWYWDAPDDPKMQMESFITNELVPYIDKRFPTIPQASKRAITGLSMGGHGALWLATRHPHLFKNAGSMSGHVNVAAFPNRWNIAKILGAYDADPRVWKNHSVAYQLPRMKKAGLNIIFDCGTDDLFNDINAKLHGEMLKYGIPHEYTSRPGGHTHEYWDNSVKHHLLFFNTKFKEADK